MTASFTTQDTARLVAAMASLGAGVVHAAVVPSHMAVWWASGIFFIALAAFQVLWAGAVVWVRRRTLLLLGLTVNVGSMLLWGLTRVFGQPVGPQAGGPLPVGAAGVLVLVLELVVVGAVLWHLRGRVTGPRHGVAAVLPVAGGLVLVVGITVPGVAAALRHDHADHAGDHSHQQGGGHHQDTVGRQGPGQDTGQDTGHHMGHAQRSRTPTRSHHEQRASPDGGGGAHAHDDEEPPSSAPPSSAPPSSAPPDRSPSGHGGHGHGEEHSH